MNAILTALLTVSVSTFALAANTHAYTSLEAKDCRNLVTNTSYTGYVRDDCGGLGGYRLLVEEGDLRQNVVVVRGKTSTSLDLWTIVSSSFSTLGPRAEWRLGGGVPTALIVRYNASENSADPKRITSYLAVVKLGAKPCVVAKVAPGPRQNELARQAADTASTRRCLSPS
ncbi:hypothetical protein [Deinococcus yavapaiensis]|uniref:Secreted protein n=1 Tax=Deinococcus yavapaiensis KR-236 TaxID=694435 RepID=A0A318S395_9DEIO|nr:hypothetical protein [Deinococcus yavapaiensis]PYE52862.1 hypothetical protein DES52_11133 [Deinococcus yavapaiensis KR-236]